MKKILVMGNGDSVFIKDFIRQYSTRQCVVDLISLGTEEPIKGVRYQSNCTVSSDYKIFNQAQLYKALLLSMKKMDDDYDCIVIHYISFAFALHIRKIKKSSKRIVAVVWGSDFYRIHGKFKIFLQNMIYSYSTRIVFTNIETLNRFSSVKKGVYTKKLTVARFGLPVLDEIDKLNKTLNYNEWCTDFRVPSKKIKIMVGYNAKLSHHQLLVIDQISELSKENIELFHLVFPLGYGNSDSKNIIESKLLEKKIKNYTILEDFYNFQDVAKLRCITDILINIQPSDQFSGSMQETLYAGNKVITGSWLPYKEIVSLGAEMVLIDKPEDVGYTISKVINNYNERNDSNLDRVKEYIHKSSSWSENLKSWDSILFDDLSNINNSYSK